MQNVYINLTPGFDAAFESEVHIYCTPVFWACDTLSNLPMKGRLANPYVTSAIEIESETVKDIEVNFKKHILNSISVSPNPSNGLFLVQLNTDDGNSSLKTIRVYDITGRKVMAAEIDVKSYMLDLSALPKGIYFLHASDINKQYNKKIIIN